MGGNRLNICKPLFTNVRYNHTSFHATAPTISGYYKYSACSPGVSALYQEFANDNSQCDPSVSPAVLTKSLSGACSRTEDPFSGDVFYVQNAQCITGDAMPPAPDGSVIMVLYSSADTCADAEAVAFNVSSTSYCSLTDPSSSWSQLNSLSLQHVCTASGQPQQMGFLGTHCTKKSNSVNLPTLCGPIPTWMGLQYALGWKYQCTPPAKPTSPSGWLTQTYYANADCTGPILSMQGQATGTCNVGYNNESLAVSSLMTTCDGTVVYASLDCSGQASRSVSVAQDSCVPTRQGPNRGGMSSGASYRLGCSTQYDSIPTPFQGLSVTLRTYQNDVCSGPANTFAKLPQDAYISLLSDPKAADAYTQLVDCSSGSPVLTTTLGNGRSFTSYSEYFDTSCSFVDPAYTSQRGTNGPTALGAGHDHVSYYRSQVFSSCSKAAPPPPPPPSGILTFPHPSDSQNYAGAVAGVVISILIVSLLVGGIWYYYKHYYVKAQGDRASFLRSPGQSR